MRIARAGPFWAGLFLFTRKRCWNSPAPNGPDRIRLYDSAKRYVVERRSSSNQSSCSEKNVGADLCDVHVYANASNWICNNDATTRSTCRSIHSNRGESGLMDFDVMLVVLRFHRLQIAPGLLQRWLCFKRHRVQNIGSH